MANLSTNDKQILEKLFQMGGGYVLNFSDRTMSEFFRDDLKLNIYSKRYNYASGSKANHMRGFWMVADDKTVGRSILKLIEYIRTQILVDSLSKSDFPEERLVAGGKIGERLLGKKLESQEEKAEVTFKNGNITVTLQKEILDHVQKLLNDRHYFNAIEEAYKVVRKKLVTITGSERATDAFNEANIIKIFGHKPKDEAERDFFEGVKFLHMAIQFLRNEKAHTLAQDLDKNLAIHYIALASLAYDLINRKYQ
ncbi:TIGR02391 family protein [Patescibacteria group bacterium]|nr:TIGR02391 family protein [Patescibacteria group bacterium]